MKLAHIVIFCLLALPALAQKPEPILPQSFAGWEKDADARLSADPADADRAYGPVLKEFGFQAFEEATYTQPNRKLQVRAIRFEDASGAYGGFTFYKQPQMLTESVGEQAGWDGVHVIFYRGNILVNATLDRVTAMSAAQLRALSDSLPLPPQHARTPPSLPTYLPKQGYVKNSARYVLGPAGLAEIAAPISADLVDFSRDPEVVVGKYETLSGQGTMVLVAYPTPQIAAERFRAMVDARNGEAAPASEDESTASLPGLEAKRTGPIVALFYGKLPAGEARSLLAEVNYDADVTWNEQTSVSPKDNIGNLLIAAFVLIGIMLSFAIVAGVAFGGVRLLVKRLFPDKVFDRSQDLEIIKLDLGK